MPKCFGMSQKCCTFAPSKQKDDNRSLILGYGVMVTQQILVLFFLVRVRVAQQIKSILEKIQDAFSLYILSIRIWSSRLKRINVTNGSRLTRSFVLFLEKYECLKDIMR